MMTTRIRQLNPKHVIFEGFEGHVMNSKTTRQSILLFCFLLVAPHSNAWAVETATWTGFGSWSDATRWSTDPDVPNNTGTTTYDVIISSGTVTSDVTGVTVDGLTLNGGQIRGTENITVTNSGSWSKATISDSAEITIDTGATFDINGSDAKALRDQASLTVKGNVNLSGSGVLRSTGTATTDVAIGIEAGGVFDIQSDADIVGEFGTSLYRKGTLTNAGMLKKSVGSGVSTIDENWDLINTGSIVVESGTLQFSNLNFGNVFNNAGTATVQSGTLEFGNGASTGSFDVQAGSNMVVDTTASGQQSFNGAQITNNGTLTIDGNAQFTGGTTYTGSGSVVLAASGLASGAITGDDALSLPNFNWSGGQINSTGVITIPSTGTATVSGGNEKRLGDAAKLMIDGVANVTSTSNIDTFASVSQPATIEISPTGTLDFQSNAGLSDRQSGFNSSRAGLLTIGGTLRKSAATGTSTVTKNWTIVNDGQVDVQTGTLKFDGDVSGSGSYTGVGTVVFDGEFSPGNGPVEIDFAGDVEFDSDATLIIEIGGYSAGTEFDVLDITGASTLGGQLQVSLIDQFEPALGDSFEVLNADMPLSGTFSSTVFPLLTNSLLGWSIEYDTNTVSLEVVPLETAEADFNEDTHVDNDDLLIWQTGFGTVGSATKSIGDTDEDLDVDGQDFLVWQRQFTANSLPPATIVTVPESSTGYATLAGVMSVMVGFRRPMRFTRIE